MEAKVDVSDTGLGLNDFISGGKKEAAETTSSSTLENTDVKADITSDVKDDNKSDDKKELDAKVAVSDEKKEEVVDSKPSVNWDSDENTYKKRYYDTAKWANNINQELAGIKKDVSIANKKLDGTYDAEAEAKAAEVDPQILTQQAETRGKVSASMVMAEEQFGKEYVQKMIFADDAPFRQYDNDPYVQGRVLSSNAPVMEAIRILKEREFFGKYGHEPDKIITNIRAEGEKELTDKVTKQVTEQIMKRIDEKGKQITGLSNARGSETKTEVKQTVKPLSSIFQN